MILRIIRTNILLIGFLIALLCGCGQNDHLKTESNLKTLEARFDSLKNEVEANIYELGVLRAAFYNDDSSIVLDVGSLNTYQKLNIPTGFFLISIIDTKPYLDGYKVYLNIGNPFFITYGDIKCKVKWGIKNENFKREKYIEWWQSLRKKEISFTQEIKPGSWNKVELILVPAKPEELGYIKLDIETDYISLIKER
jgi:hypothetical protein